MADVIALNVLHAIRDTFNVARQLGSLTRRACTVLAASLGATHSLQKLRAAARCRPVAALGASAVAAALVALSVALLIGSEGRDAGAVGCPAIMHPHASHVAVSGGPHALLGLALQARGSGEWNVANRMLLKQCFLWEPPHGFTLPMGEARAQLECHGTFVKTMVEEDAASSEALALVDRTRAGLVAIGKVSNQCETVHQKLLSLRRADQVAKSPLKAIVALGGLAGLEQPAAEAFKTLKLISDILERRMEAGDWDAEDSMHEVPPLRIRFRACLARAVREARSIAQALPQASPATLKARRCHPDLLVKVEQLAISEAEAEGDPGVIFNTGQLMSEASMTANDVPFFGTKPSRSDWSLDSRGFSVPTGIANAEDMLWKGFQASFGPDETERAALHTIRICQHAKILVQLKLGAAAEWRYRAGAELASKYGRHKLASHCLAQLSYFLYVNGFEEKPLDVADEAVTLGSDPLASYLQVMLRSNLGLLRTDGETRSAAKQLAELQGQLHAKELEETRTSIHANLVVWEGVSEAGTISSCFSLSDSAQVLICVLARFAYM